MTEEIPSTLPEAPAFGALSETSAALNINIPEPTFSIRFEGKVEFRPVSYTKDGKTIFVVEEVVTQMKRVDGIPSLVEEEIYSGVYEEGFADAVDAIDRATRLNEKADFLRAAEKEVLVPPKALA